MSIKKPQSKTGISPDLAEYAESFSLEKDSGEEAIARIFSEIREVIQGFFKDEKTVQASAENGDLLIMNLLPSWKPEIIWTDKWETRIKARWTTAEQKVDSLKHIPLLIRTAAIKILTRMILDHEGEIIEIDVRTSNIILEKKEISLGNETVQATDDNEKYLEGIFYAVFAAIRDKVEMRMLASGDRIYSSM